MKGRPGQKKPQRMIKRQEKLNSDMIWNGETADHVSRGLIIKMICSALLQAWIPYLESDDAEKAVGKCGYIIDVDSVKQVSRER